jgi:hypothetical protein
VIACWGERRKDENEDGCWGGKHFLPWRFAQGKYEWDRGERTERLLLLIVFK